MSVSEKQTLLLKQKRLFSFLAPKTVPPIPSEDERIVFPQKNSNFVKRAFFWWLNPILKVGYLRTLQPEDLYILTDDLTVQNMYEKFLHHYHAKSRFSSRNHLLYCLVKTFWLDFSLSCLYFAIFCISLTLNPLLSRHLINFVENKSNDSGKGVGYAIGNTAIIFMAGFFQNHGFQKGMMVGARSKAVLTKVAIEKSFKLNNASKHSYPTSKVISMLGGDMSRIDQCFGYVCILITFPFPIIIAIVLLIVNIGISGFIGVILVFIFIAVLTITTKRLMKLRSKINVFTDERLQYIQEALQNLRLIKFFSWENPYFEKLKSVRNSEMDVILRLQALRNILMATSMSFTNVSSMVSFLVLYALNGTKNPGSIFASLSLFNVLSQQVYVLPQVSALAVDAYVSAGRISDFLTAGENDQKPSNNVSPFAIDIHADFEWPNFDGKKPSGLKNIDLSIKPGEFVVITGSVGTGKSSLLQAIAGMMPRTKGSINVYGTVACFNNPWIQNDTIKNNILFGSEYDPQKFRDVINNCCLDVDLHELPAGELTELGEFGVTLSGGQKARINLARAVYSDRDIILLDDVLSAVDAKVGKQIMQNCILNYLKGKTRVLATHQVSLIGAADRVIYFTDKGTVDVGTLKELEERNVTFKASMAEVQFDEKPDEPITKEATSKGELIIKEEKAVNELKAEVYKSYIKYGSGSFTIPGWILFYLITTVLTTFCSLFSNVWLSFWIEDKFKKPNRVYIGLYIAFSLLTVVFLINELLSIVYLSNTSSRTLHIKALQKVLHAPLSYMDTTPTGRILNRFSRDSEVLDNEISNQLRIASYTLSTIIGVIILCIIYLPWFAICVPVLGLLFVMLLSFYQASSREIKRIDSVQRSFVYSSFGEILNGLDIIKAFDAKEFFMNKLDHDIDKMNEAYYLTITFQRYLSINLSIISTIFTLIISLLCVFRIFNISAASVGLLLSYTLQITTMLNQLMRSTTQIENEMNSVERMCQLALHLEQEAPYVLNDREPPPEWPFEGSLKFENVCMSYRPGLPLVLKNVNLEIKGNEKIGICGRTGAGKSSIMTAIFRMCELDKGNITLDGINISELGLHQLRSKLTIIPQDPVLFKGTVRSNLDPFSQTSDEYMYLALTKVGLLTEKQVENLKANDDVDTKFGLDHIVDHEGMNFSLGEKQMISFARAIVRDSKILILDEATSSVDYENDRKIQLSIARDFENCTILCIAHRLRTILSYDKILVLEKGSICEFDTPWNLYKKKGTFRQLCDKSDIVEEDFS